MEVNLQIYNDGDQITISEPNEENHLVLRVAYEEEEEMTELILTCEMAEKIRDWLSNQIKEMKINKGWIPRHEIATPDLKIKG